MMKKFCMLVALLVFLTAAACAETLDRSEVTGFWMNTDGALVSLEIREDGSGTLMDVADESGVPIQVKEPRSELYDYTICLGSDDNIHDLMFDEENDTLVMLNDEGRSIVYVRDYWYGLPVACVAPSLRIRYSPDAFELTYHEDGSLLMTCNYREGGRDYISISLVKNTTMAYLLDGLALQSGQDGVAADYGCWDFEADEAGSVDYIRSEDGLDYDCFFMAVQCGDDCYLVECHSACLGDPETDPENSLSDLYAETLGSISMMYAR